MKKTVVVREAITLPVVKNKIYTVNKTEKPQASKRKNIKLSVINQTKVDQWINRASLKEISQKTKYNQCINKG